MSDRLCRAIAHLTCREAYPKWDELLTKMSAGRTKAQKRAIFWEDYIQRKAARVVKESAAEEDANLFGIARKG